MNTKHKILAIMAMICIVLIVGAVGINQANSGGGLTWGGEDDGGVTYPSDDAGPTPTYTPYPYNPTPTPERSEPKTHWLYLSIYQTMVSPREDIQGQVTSDVPNIDVTVFYGPFIGGGGEVLSGEKHAGAIQPVLWGGDSITVHINANGSSDTFTVGSLPEGTYYFTAYSLDGTVASNTVEVKVVVIY